MVIVALAISAGGKAKAFLFALGGFLGVFVTTLITSGLGSLLSTGSSDAKSPVKLVLAIVLTLLFGALTVTSFHSRPRAGATAKQPGWMSGLDRMNPILALAFGAVLTVVNGKNLPLLIRTGIDVGGTLPHAASLVVYSACFALASVLVPLAIAGLAAAPSTRISSALQQLKATLSTENWIIMSILFFVLTAMEISHVVSYLTA